MKTLLDAEIAQAGGILPFCDFMHLCLYHPHQGYYMSSTPRLGRQGDFVTAPEMTSLFGQLLTLQWIEIWQRMDQPGDFQLVEMGGGSGRLAADILQTSRRFPEFHEALNYTLIELSPDFQKQQQQTIEKSGLKNPSVQWSTHLKTDTTPTLEGVLFSNEFLDALPVHWVEMTEDGLKEVGVISTPSGYETTLIPISTKIPPDYFSTKGITLAKGVRTEIGIEAGQWMQKAAHTLKRGIILTIDYGYTQEEYYGPALPMGTLCGFYQHQQLNNPLLHPGKMDLTSHVDFSALTHTGEHNGLTTLGYTTQGWFLMGLGILERLETLAHSQPQTQYDLVRQTVMKLIMPQTMGERFKVLVQGKGVSSEPLAGFRLNNRVNRVSLKPSI